MPSSHPGLGVGCMLAGTFILTCHDAVAKWMTAQYSVAEVMCYRSIPALAILAVMLLREGGSSAFVPRSPGPNLLRAVLATLTSFLVVASYAVLPLADALAIIFSNPIFLTALSVPLLGEHVGWRRWAAVLAGFVGIIVMIEPTAEVFRFGAIIAVGAALVASLRDVVTRRMAATDSATNVLFYTTVVSLAAGAALMPAGAYQRGWPSAHDWSLFVLAGALVTAAHWLVIKSLQLAQASLVAPLRYLAIVYAAVLGYVVFDELPGLPQIAGAAIVVSAALYIMHRERQRTA